MAEIIEMNSHEETSSTKPEEQVATPEVRGEEAVTANVSTEAADGSGLKIPGAAERPEWLPEKFSSAEDLAKAYQELEKGKSGAKEETAQPASLGADALQPFAEEYHKTGTISEDSYGKLAGMGLAKDFVDNYIAGVEAQATAATNTIYQVAGGQASFETMVSWATDNLPPNEISAFNSAMDAGSLDTATMAVKALAASYHGAHGTTPQLLSTGTASTGIEVYESLGQMMKDMQDPRYKDPHDDSWRKKVAAKLARSNIGNSR